VNNEEIKQTIASFPRWHYQFNLRGNLTLSPLVDKGRILRHKERKKYFFDLLVQLLGGSLVGIRVLDIGCNAGFWSYAQSKADAISFWESMEDRCI